MTAPASAAEQNLTPKSGRPAPRITPAPGESLHLLAARALIAFRALRHAEAGLARAQGACLLRILDRRLHLRAGFARFTDFTREVLQQAPRTTKRRLALTRTLAACPILERAFLAHRLTPCQVLALRPLAGHSALPFWIELAGTLPVRDLHRRVRAAVAQMEAEGGDTSQNTSGQTIDSNADEERGIRVTFATPMAAAVTWDQALDLARRVLGWDAPPHLCVEAILAEASTELAAHFPLNPEAAASAAPHSPTEQTTTAYHTDITGEEPSPTADSTPEFPCRFVTRTPHPGSGALDALRSTLARTELELHRIQHLLPARSGAASGACAGSDPGPRQKGASHPGAGSDPDSPVPLPPQALIRRARSLDRLDRPLRILQARLLLALLRADGVIALGHDSLAAFAEESLGLAPRTARRLLAQAFLLDDRPALARAYTRGRIGAGQAFLVHRIALNATLPAFLLRAEQVTHLAFEREVRFLERLREVVPSVASRFRGPFPLPGLEQAMLRALADRGWGTETIRARLRSHGLTLHDDGLPPSDSKDPARDPTVLRRLELILECMVLADAEYDVRAAAHRESRGGAHKGAPLSDLAPSDQVTDEAPTPGRPTVAPDPRLTTITFWAPLSLHRHWTACLSALRSCRGEVPTWVGATWIAEIAMRQWQQTEPARRTTATRILERDDYRCRAPGCSARRRLEVHHIRFRSQHGSDAPQNLLSLCATHHRHVVHAGWLLVSGQAPGALSWDRCVS